MSESTDLEVLARRYLDLWQNQMAAMASDPAMAEAFGHILTLLGLKPSEATASEKNPLRTTATTAAPHHADRDDSALLRRIASLEKRIARLESASLISRRRLVRRNRGDRA